MCLYFTTDQKLRPHKLMDRIIGRDHSLGRNEVLKFVYCFMILFLTIYIFKYFLLLVPFSHQKSATMHQYVNLYKY
jgi:hypothetical protein